MRSEPHIDKESTEQRKHRGMGTNLERCAEKAKIGADLERCADKAKIGTGIESCANKHREMDTDIGTCA